MDIYKIVYLMVF